MNHKGHTGTRRKALAALCVLCGFLLSSAAAQNHPKSHPPHTPPVAIDQDAIELAADPAFHETLSNQQVQVYRLELAPQTSTQLDNHPRDYIVLAITSAHLQA